MLEWISEGEALPIVGQTVLLASPRQFDKFWDIRSAMILVRHEAVVPRPIVAGDDWPTDYYWALEKGNRDTRLVTGNNWWASLAEIPLPPGARHTSDRLGYNYIEQIGSVFIPKRR